MKALEIYLTPRKDTKIILEVKKIEYHIDILRYVNTNDATYDINYVLP